MSRFTVECVEFKLLRRNTLYGFCAFRMSELRLVLHDVTLHQKGGSRSSKPNAFSASSRQCSQSIRTPLRSRRS
jgi:hypothetical protein